MTPSLPGVAAAALFWACAVAPADAAAEVNPACAATEKHEVGDARMRSAIDEARRQHGLFGGQTIERNGGMFRVGYHEAEWDRPVGESTPTWERVATFWRALSESEPPELMTSAGLVARSEAARDAAAAGGQAARAEVAVREALLRAAIVDTPWSAAFISYLMKTAGFSGAEFAFSDSHADYVQAAFAASDAETAGGESAYAFRACDVATTRPRAGDLVCATRAGTAGISRFDDLAAAMRARAAGQDFPMHCELVVRSDEGGDAKLETIGGNVVQSVTLSRMTLNAKKVLSDGYVASSARMQRCARAKLPCRDHLTRRPWVAVLQFRG
jgi:hypothetical protein